MTLTQLHQHDASHVFHRLPAAQFLAITLLCAELAVKLEQRGLSVNARPARRITRRARKGGRPCKRQ